MNHLIKQAELAMHAKQLEQGKKDIQGLITRGYNSLNAARYVILKITDEKLAKDYFNQLSIYITTGEKKTYNDVTPEGDPITAVQIAFTAAGLRKLKLSEKILNTFSREFIEGMNFPNTANPTYSKTARSTLLGDTKNNNPDYWHWGGDESEVHCMILLFAEKTLQLEKLLDQVYWRMQKGVELVHMGNTYEYPVGLSKEHFGFDDGISQPVISGLSQSKAETTSFNLLKPGEFVLGYKNEYDAYSPSPYIETSDDNQDLDDLPDFSDKKDLGKNGCYLVMRQIEQHVDEFWRFNYNHSVELGVTQSEKAVRLASKMIGRWPKGQPLATCPLSYDSNMSDEAFYDFKFTPDKDGLNCPLGAHIRRTNPRDHVHAGRSAVNALEMSKKHRMLRRGRIYGEPMDPKFDIEKIIAKVKDLPERKEIKGTRTEIVRGLYFICLVSDIQRQFEFVQSVWANTSTFGDLCNEVDPVISPRPTEFQPNCHEFTSPQAIIRNRYKNVPEFTTVVGGQYFFLPSIRALRYIIKDR